MFSSSDLVKRVAIGLVSLLGLGSAGCESKNEPEPIPQDAANRGDCLSDADCGGDTAICDGLNGCVACQYDTDCEAEQRCFDYACAAAPSCTDESECEGTSFPVCDSSTRQCEECLENSDCVEGNRCNEEQRCETVVGCKNSADCQDSTVCDRTQGFCVECIADLDCAEGNVCDAQTCVPACEAHEDCSDERSWCDTIVGHCVECIVDKDCPSDYFCDSGSCSLDACESGSSFCDAESNAVHECLENGRDYSVLLCSSGTTCSEGVSETTCENWICNPGAVFCDPTGDELNTCELTGLALANSLSCADMGGRCLNEACVDVICEAGQSVCQDGASYLCDATGTELSLQQTCGAGFFCNDSSGLCEVNKCTAGEGTCNGDVLSTCNATGSGYLAGGVDCAESDQVCISGACRDVICSFESRCNGINVETCVQDGTRIESSPCSSSYHCAEADGEASCEYDVCTQNVSSCVGNIRHLCNADGSGYESTLDCSSLGMSCNTSRGCVAEIGGSTVSTSSDNYIHVNHFVATSTETLTGISMYIDTYFNPTMSWVVYESSTAAGSYTVKYSGTTTSLSSAAYWHLSPTMNVELEVGKHYLIGVQVVDVDSAYYGLQSVGSRLGSMEFAGRSSIYDALPLSVTHSLTTPGSTSYAYYMRLSF